MRIAFDMSSVMWTCLLVGKDGEGHVVEFEGKWVHINRAEHGYENAVNLMVAAMNNAEAVPIDCTLVFEGTGSKRRRSAIESSYKAGRGERHPLAYEEFNRLKEMLSTLWLGVGANALTQDFVEGDDLLAWLAENAEEPLMIVSNDNDLMVLHGPNRFGVDIQVRIDGEVGRNKYGPFDHKLITVYKALVGDTSDNIKGCPGFGKAAFADFIGLYGEDGAHELRELLEASNLRPLDDLPDNKVLNKIRSEHDSILRSYTLAKLHPEWCDTAKLQVQWSAGMVKEGCADERLRKFSGKLRLVDASTFDAALDFFKSKLAESPFLSFDIETSTPDESDEWLERQGNPNGVDVIGSFLVGFSFTFGRNTQYTYYVSVAHKDTNNITMSQARRMIEAACDSGKSLVIQNTSFELSVLYQAQDEDGSLWKDHFQRFGQRGFLPNILDTKIEASYVDENLRLGLKDRSQIHLGYTQQTFKDVTTIDGIVYKMDGLTAQHVFSYGADDAICTAALHNWYKLVMQLEHTYNVYLKVEIDACYLHAYSFIRGVRASMATLQELAREDDAIYEKAEKTFHAYLIEQKWEGTMPPVYDSKITPAQVKEAYKIVTGEDLTTMVRMPDKLVTIIKSLEQPIFAGLLAELYAGNPEKFTAYVQSYFKGKPEFNDGSPKQMQKLLYETMGLPIRIRNPLTAAARANGVTQGSPKTDASAISYALLDCTPEQKPILEALRLLAMVGTRRSLYYDTYPGFVHWKTGLIHSSHNQSATVTRRASSSGPNLQQLPVTAKIEGTEAKFRSVIKPHKVRGAVVMSFDFTAQELLSMAYQSQDPAMLSAYVGENLRDLHLVTALEILKSKHRAVAQWSYDLAAQAYNDPTHEHHALLKRVRAQAKNVNFAGQYNVGAEKLGVMLKVSKDDAQAFLDAKARAFPVVEKWKEETEAEAKRTGKAYTLLGSIRHLASLLNSDDKFVASKASRQAINYRIQGSCGEQTKLVEGAVWRSGVLFDYDCWYYFPCHDETVFSVADEHAFEVAQKVHSMMTMPYGGMTVPIKSSIGFGRDFYNLTEIGTTLDKEIFMKELAAL